MMDYDADTDSNFEEDRNDTKINPEKYINNTILKMEDALASNEPEKMLTYFSLVEHLEDLERALKMIDEDHEKSLNTASKELEDKTTSADKFLLFRVANKKSKLLLECLFMSGKIEDKLDC